MEAVPWIINLNDPEARGLLQSTASENLLSDLEFIRRDGRKRALQMVARNGNDSGIIFDSANVSASAVIEVAVGTPDLGATSGNFGLSYLGNSTGLTALAYNIAANTLQTALNANAAIITAGGVTVTKASLNGQYLVTFSVVGARADLVIDPGTLSPPPNVGVVTVQDGDASTRAVQLVSLLQGYLAYSTDWTLNTTGTIGIAQTQTGSDVQPSIQTVTISSSAIGGTWRLQATQAQVCSLKVAANQAVKAQWTIIIGASPVVASGDFIDISDGAGPVRLWFNVSGGGGAPDVPLGGRLLEVVVAGATTAVLQSGLFTALDADAGFGAVGVGAGIVVANAAAYGAGGAGNTYGTGMTLAGGQGNYGRLDQASAVIYDANGSVGIWVNISNEATPPAALEAVNRLIVVTAVTIGSTADAAAIVIKTAIDADAAFAATVSTDTVTITNSVAGARSLPVQNTALLGLVETVPGYTLSGSFDLRAGAGDVEAVFGNYYSVTASDPFTWQLVALSNGTRVAMTVSAGGVIFAGRFDGTLNLSNWNMLLAFNAVTSNTIDSTLEVQITEPGEQPVKVLNIPISIRRDVIIVGAVSNPSSTTQQGGFLPAVSGYIGGTIADLDSVATGNKPVPSVFFFIHATEGLRFYLLRSGTDAEDSPLIIQPDDFAAANEKVWQSIG